jgi:hypothetical protein
MTTAQGLTDLSAICFQRLRIEILIAFRDYGFVDHVELIGVVNLRKVTVVFGPVGQLTRELGSDGQTGFCYCVLVYTVSYYGSIMLHV